MGHISSYPVHDACWVCSNMSWLYCVVTSSQLRIQHSNSSRQKLASTQDCPAMVFQKRVGVACLPTDEVQCFVVSTQGCLDRQWHCRWRKVCQSGELQKLYWSKNGRLSSSPTQRDCGRNPNPTSITTPKLYFKRMFGITASTSSPFDTCAKGGKTRQLAGPRPLGRFKMFWGV